MAHVDDAKTQAVIHELETQLKAAIKKYLTEPASGENEIVTDLARIEKLASELQKWMLI